MKNTWKNDKKKMLFVIEGAVIIILLLSLFGHKFYITNIKETVLTFDDQVVDKVSFKNFKLTYKSKATDISVKLLNTEKKSRTIKKVFIVLLDEEGLQLSRIEVSFEQMIDGKAQYLELTNLEEANVEARVLDNLTETKKIEYSFE